MNVFRFYPPDQPRPSAELLQLVEAEFNRVIAIIDEQPQVSGLTFDERAALFAFLLQRAMRGAER